ncbi:MAG: hypothetical protein LC803_20260 [Acidobacteria bacterium]|nr:hypothetical protein [Acidobacteriota bacterium]
MAAATPKPMTTAPVNSTASLSHSTRLTIVCSTPTSPGAATKALASSCSNSIMYIPAYSTSRETRDAASLLRKSLFAVVATRL